MDSIFYEDDALREILDYSFEKFSTLQIRKELVGFLNIYKERNRNTVVEIGRYRGGTLYPLLKLADTSSLLVSIDISSMINIENEFSKYVTGDQRLEFIAGDSTLVDTKNLLLGIICNRKIDILFIDGGHLYETIKTDFENYLPLMAEKSIIAIHDTIKTDNCESTEDVKRFWDEVKILYRTDELIDPTDYRHIQGWGGIGIVYIGEEVIK
jgi:predicted O-methyltransferase YrrM